MFVSSASRSWEDADLFVLLVVIVDVAVEDLDEQLDGDSRVHAGVGHAQRALKAFKHTLAITVELD